MLLYRAAFANQTKPVDFGDGLGALPMVNEDQAVRSAVKLVKEWTRKAGCSSPIVCLSAVESDSFRHRLWAGYKAGRKDGKPEAYAAARKAIEFEYETYEEPNLEADDLMGIAATSGKAQTVIVSGDKDMMSIPGLLLNPLIDQPKPRKITLAQADAWWMRQTMTGDAVDGYPGITKVGEVSAQDILTSPHRLRKTTVMVGKKAPKPKTTWEKGEPTTVWQSMLDYAARAGMSEEDVILQAQLARILRTGDFDKSTRTVRLWRPNGQHKDLKL